MSRIKLDCQTLGYECLVEQDDSYLREIFTPRIKERPAFEFGGRLYRTKTAAAKKAAWHMILQKYPDMAQIKQVLWHKCDCFDDHPTGEYGEQIGYLFEVCPLHARDKLGYFHRLHEKLTNAIGKQLQEGTK